MVDPLGDQAVQQGSSESRCLHNALRSCVRWRSSSERRRIPPVSSESDGSTRELFGASVVYPTHRCGGGLRASNATSVPGRSFGIGPGVWTQWRPQALPGFVALSCGRLRSSSEGHRLLFGAATGEFFGTPRTVCLWDKRRFAFGRTTRVAFGRACSMSLGVRRPPSGGAARPPRARPNLSSDRYGWSQAVPNAFGRRVLPLADRTASVVGLPSGGSRSAPRCALCLRAAWQPHQTNHWRQAR